MPIIVESLRAIGCPTVAGITVDAIEVLKLQPGSGGADVQRAVLDLSEIDQARLSALDDRFYEHPDPIEERLFAYVVDHRHEIVLS